MTKKQFESLAERLRAEKPDTFGGPRYTKWESIVRSIAFWCQEQHPQFDYVMFIRACGIEIQDHTK